MMRLTRRMAAYVMPHAIRARHTALRAAAASWPQRAPMHISMNACAIHTHAQLHTTQDASSFTDPTAATSAAAPPSSPPLTFAVVGSGPAAFYTTKYLLREMPDVKVHMFERLPVPFGLVRFGVAPDHPDVKSVTNDFDQIARDPRFSFFGNVEVGRDIQLDELRRHYSGVVLAYGAASERTINIPGSNLRGIHPSRHFVNWYNGHPEHGESVHDFDLSQVQTAVIIGQGNVAIDCARVLLAPLDRLQSTDISTHALEKLASSNVTSVHMVGRRGAVQSAFSIGELREMATGVDGIRVVIPAEEVAASENEASLAEIAASRPKKRKHELVKQVVADNAAADQQQADANSTVKKPHELHIRYLLNPKEFKPDEKDPSRVGAIVFEKTELRGLPEHQEAVPTGETITLPTGLVLTSIGYRSLPIPGLPFDPRRSIVPSSAGRVQSEGLPESGLYVAGWLKRGPSGIIATNIMDARETVKSIMHDIREGVVKPAEVSSPLPFLSEESRAANAVVDGVAWEKIDASERARGQETGRPRIKITTKQQLLEAAGVSARTQ